MTEHVSLRMDLLDQQVVDCDRLPIGRVDDLELAVPDGGGPPAVTSILTGAQALGERLGGRAGAWMAACAERLRPRGAPVGPAAIDTELIAEIEPMVRLRIASGELPHVAGLERWLARHVIEPLPGAGDARK